MKTYTMNLEDRRYVVRDNDGTRMGSARTKRQAQDLIDALLMMNDQTSRIQYGSK